MKSAVAQIYFESGESQKGEALFEELTNHNPTWGWGWIFWADVYSGFVKTENKDYDRAIQMLEQALQIKGLKDRQDVLERLEEVKEEM